jgi:4,5-DOPA dioxygenase extradiol
VMPALFVGHGSPLNAVEDNEFSRAWTALAKTLPRPKAVLCVSGHWETEGTRVTAGERPETIHDFGGFPRRLHEFEYPAPGSPWLAKLVTVTVRGARVGLDERRGLDHGAWSVLCRLFPKADIPVAQLSLDAGRTARRHLALGRELAPLRREGVLVLGTGNISHNLGLMRWEDSAFDWAVEFDAAIKRAVAAGDDAAVAEYEKLGEPARLAVPTPDHFWPLLYVLGVREKGEPATFFTEKVTLGSMSMTSLRLG